MLKQEAIYNKAVAGRCIEMQRPFSYGFSQSSEGFACEGNARQKSTRYAGVSQEVIQLKSPFRYNVVVQVTIAGKER